jgi:hypothetical protein
MKARPIIGLAALLPTALGASPAAARFETVLLCSGDTLRSIILPAAPPPPDRDTGEICWAKGCHAGGQRKRLNSHI